MGGAGGHYPRLIFSRGSYCSWLRRQGARDVRRKFRAICQENGIEANYGWKIFEVTGTREGQEIALELLSFVGRLILIGFGTQKNEYSLSRLMAFDAEIIGTWGCLPEYYERMLYLIRTPGKPVIARINGVVAGGGNEINLAWDADGWR